MKTWVRRSLNAGALTAGALLVSGAAAQAAPALDSSDNIGLLNGTQALVPVQVPVNVCGNAIAVAGEAAAECVGGATALSPEWGFDHFRTSDNVGALNGTQLFAPVQVPVNVCGNAVSVLGGAAAQCEGGAEADNTPKPPHKKPPHKKPGYGKPGHKPDYKPDYRADHEPGHKPDKQQPPHQPKGKDRYGHGGSGSGPGWGGGSHGGGSHGGSDLTMLTTGNVGLLNGTQAVVPVQVPINICGNAVAVLLASAQAGCEGGATAELP